MGTAAHRIGRIGLTLTAPDQAGCTAAATAFEDGFEVAILPVIEAALDQIDAPGRVLRLNRLVLDLGRLDSAAPDFAGALARALAAALPGRAAAPGAEAPARGPAQGDLGDELVAYLASGVLPWPDPGAALEVLVAEIARLGEARLADLARRLLPLLIRATVRRRFLAQLPQALIARLVFALAGWPAATILAVPAERRLAPAEAEALEPLVAALARSGGAPTEAAALTAALIAPAALAAAKAGTSTPEPAPPAAGTPRRADDDVLAEAECPLPVTAAGAVLLHPYLPRFLDALSVLTYGRFARPEDRARGVLLGQFLATGHEAPVEPECVLMKLLCGMPLDVPLPRSPPIGPAERAEADALLRAVIEHWGRLGATTPDGLREGFLSRPGLLRATETGPALAVERRSIDILLDRLPWTLSRVKTPFMDRVLAVEWV